MANERKEFAFTTLSNNGEAASLQIIFVSKQVICLARERFDLTRSQSGQIKHVFPSHVYTNWYCGPVIKSKYFIFCA